MKTLALLVITVSLVWAVLALPIAPTFAQSTVTLSFSPQSGEGPSNSTYPVSVQGAGLDKINVARFQVNFNASILNFTEARAGSLIANASVHSNPDNSKGTVVILIDVPGLTGVSGSGELVKLSFSVKGSPGSSGELTITGIDLADSNAKAIPATASIGSFRVSSSGTAAPGSPSVGVKVLLKAGQTPAAEMKSRFVSRRGAAFILAVEVDPGAFGVGAAELLLNLDPGVFELLGSDRGDLFGKDTTLVVADRIDAGGGVAEYVAARSGPVPTPSPKGELVRFRVRIRQVAKTGEYQVVLKEVRMTGPNAAVVPVTGEPLTVLIRQPKGKVVGDEEPVGLKDLAALARGWRSKSGEVLWNAGADLNEDGVVDLLDLALLAQYWGKKED